MKGRSISVAFQVNLIQRLRKSIKPMTSLKSYSMLNYQPLEKAESDSSIPGLRVQKEKISPMLSTLMNERK